MGTRINTILQSAFFKLANVIPFEDALGYMKAAAEMSYAKKGQDVVEKNWNAIDAGYQGIVKIEIPARKTCIEPGVDERDIEMGSVVGDKIPDLIVSHEVHRCIEDLALLVMVLSQELGHTYTAVCICKKTYEYDAASRPV
jgi:hypothetical protein